MTHALKTWPEYYNAVDLGIKNFELRKNDRPFKVGDTILLQEWDNKTNQYTGKELNRIITYIISAENTENINRFGLYADYCVIGMKEKDY